MHTRKWLAALGIGLITLMPVIWAQEPTAAKINNDELTLARCQELAAQNSSELKAAAKNVKIAAAAVSEARSGFYPKLDYTVFASQSDEAIYPFAAMQVFDRIYGTSNASTDASGVTLSLAQPLYTGGKLSNALKLAEIQLKVAKESAKKAQQQLTFDVKQSFYQAWLAECMLKVAQSALENLERHVDRMNNFYKVGTVSKYETLQAKVQRDSLKPQVIAAQNNVELAKLNLSILIGFPKERQYSVKVNPETLKLPEKLKIELRSTIDLAYLRRPEMSQIKQLQETQQFQLKLAEAEYKPTVALVGQYQGSSTNYEVSHWLEEENRFWTCTLNVTGNFFNGFGTAAKVKGARENVELAKIKEDRLRDRIRLEVEQSLQNLCESLEKIRANQSNINLAQETLDLTKARVEAGMATTMDMMDSQLALDQALNGYYSGIASYLTAEARLDLAVGERRE